MTEPLARLPLATLTERSPIRIPHAPYDIAVVRLGDEVFALEDACNHSSASLSEGFVDGDCLVCPAHGFAFSLRSGALIRPLGRCDDQRRYPVRIVGGEVLIDPLECDP